MLSIRSRLIKLFLVRNVMKKAFDPFQSSIQLIRQKSSKMNKFINLSKDLVIERINIGEIKAEWLRSSEVDSNSKKIVLYFHSGGFCLDYNNNHRIFGYILSKISKIKILAIDYRLAPENQYPAANEDCINSYKWLLDKGYKPDEIIIGGDSSGAGLALMTLLSIRDEGLPMPKAAFLLSIMGGDLRDFDGESYITRKSKDPLNTKEIIKKYGELYLGSNIIVPPIKQDLSGLSDIFIQVGKDEILLSDSILLAERLEKYGNNVTIDVYEGMWHLFQGFADIMPEARKALKKLGEFISKSFHDT